MAVTNRFDAQFFIFDHTFLQREEDDLKDAIIYFYPSTVNDEQQCALCGQLMGMVEYFRRTCHSPPTLYKLFRSKVAVKHVGKYSLAYAGSLSFPEKLLMEQLEKLYGVFSFYMGSLDIVYEMSGYKRDVFVDKMQNTWESFVSFTTCYGQTTAEIFHNIPMLNLPKKSGTVFITSSKLLSTCQRVPGVLAGCLLHKQRVLCSQLPADMTSKLLLIRAQQRNLPCVPMETEFDLPGGVRILTVFVNESEYNQLKGGSSTSDNRHYKPSQFKASKNKPIGSVSTVSFSAFRNDLSALSLSDWRGNTPNATFSESDSEFGAGGGFIPQIMTTKWKQGSFSSVESEKNSGDQCDDRVSPKNSPSPSKLEKLAESGESCTKSWSLLDSSSDSIIQNSRAINQSQDSSTDENGAQQCDHSTSVVVTAEIHRSEDRGDNQHNDHIRNCDETERLQEDESGISFSVVKHETCTAKESSTTSEKETDIIDPHAVTQNSVESLSEQAGSMDISDGVDVDETPQSDNSIMNKTETLSISNESVDKDDAALMNSRLKIDKEKSSEKEIALNNDTDRKQNISLSAPVTELSRTENSEIFENVAEENTSVSSRSEGADWVNRENDTNPTGEMVTASQKSMNLDSGIADLAETDNDTPEFVGHTKDAEKNGDQDRNILNSSSLCAELRKSDSSTRIVDDAQTRNSVESDDVFVMAPCDLSASVEGASLSGNTRASNSSTISDSQQNASGEASMKRSDFASQQHTSENSFYSSCDTLKPPNNTDCTMPGLRPLSLYIQGNSDMVLLVLMEQDAATANTVRCLWQTSIQQLATLDYELRGLLTKPSFKSQGPCNVKYMTYDTYQKKLAGNMLDPVSNLENEFCDMTRKIHNDFQQYPLLRNMTLRSHTCCACGHLETTQETFVQLDMSVDSLKAESSPCDLQMSMDSKTKSALVKRHRRNIIL